MVNTLIAIIDHNEHQLFMEKVNIQVINRKYGGDTEAYIKEMYGFNGEDIFSWEYVAEPIETFRIDSLNIKYTNGGDR